MSAVLRVRSMFFGNPGSLPPMLNAALCVQTRGHIVSLLGLTATHQLELPRGLANSVQLLEDSAGSRATRLRNAWRFLRASSAAADWRIVNDPLTCLLTQGTLPRVVYHEHDPPASGMRPMPLLVNRARRRMLGTAKVLIFPSHERMELALRVLPEAERSAPRARSVVVWNCPMRGEIAERTRFPAPRAPLKLYFHGSITPHRLPLWILDALEQARYLPTLTVVGYETIGAAGHVAALRARAQALGLGERLTVLDSVPREALLVLAKGHDLGLCLYDRSGSNAAHNSMLGPSNKVFDYLSVGIVPVLDRHLEWQPLLNPPMALMLAENKAGALVSLLNQLAEAPAMLETCARFGQQRLRRDWHYEAQFAPVIKAMEV